LINPKLFNDALPTALVVQCLLVKLLRKLNLTMLKSLQVLGYNISIFFTELKKIPTDLRIPSLRGEIRTRDITSANQYY